MGFQFPVFNSGVPDAFRMAATRRTPRSGVNRGAASAERTRSSRARAKECAPRSLVSLRRDGCEIVLFSSPEARGRTRHVTSPPSQILRGAVSPTFFPVVLVFEDGGREREEKRRFSHGDTANRSIARSPDSV